MIWTGTEGTHMSTDYREPDLAFGDFVIDRADERVLGPDGPLRIGNKAFRVLLSLALQEGRLLTKDALFASVWDGTIVGESALTSTIKELRRALGDESRAPRYIESVYGRGYRLIPAVRIGEPSDKGRPRHDRAAAPPVGPAGRPPMVLVSQFEDISVRERHPHCAAELREEVIAGLARFREIQLVDDNRPEHEAARAREATSRDYQLTATLLPQGEGVKIIARARRLVDKSVVWAETLSLVDNGTAGGVEKIVRRIVGAALPAVDDDLSLGLPPETDDFYDSYLLAKRLATQAGSYAEARAAAGSLERLIERRPIFAPAYAPLVRLYNTDFGYTGLGSSGRPERAKALELAKAGLAADRGNVYAYSVLGFCHLWHGHDGIARDCFEQALSLNPYNSVRVQDVATGMMYLGDLARARSLIATARELNPIPDDAFFEDSGRLSLIEGDHEAARAMLLSIAQGTIWAELYLALCEDALGLNEGRERLDRWRSRVEARWHSRIAPSRAELIDWIMFHHPLSSGVVNAFRQSVGTILREAAMPPQAPRQSM